MKNKMLFFGNYKTVLFIILIFSYLLSFSVSISSIFINGMTWRLLVPFITIFLISVKAQTAQSFTCKPQPYFGLSVILIAYFIAFAGKVTSTIVVSESAVIIGFWSLFLYYYGLKAFLFFIGPLSYLLFTSSIFDDIFSLFNPVFRQISADTASFLADISGHEVLLSKTEILLPNMTLNVADQCSGVNHCISLYALAIPLAILRLNRFFPKFSFFALVLPVSIMANGVRIFIIILYNYNRQIFTHGPGNILVTGSGFFLGLLFLFLLLTFLSKTNLKVKSPTGGQTNPLIVWKHISYNKQLPLFLTLLAGFFFNNFYNTSQIRDVPVYSSLCANLIKKNWNCVSSERFPELIDFPISSRNHFFKCFKNNGDTINLYTAYYRSQDNNNEIAGYSYNSIFKPVKEIKLNLGTTSRDFLICRSVSDINDHFYLINYRCGSKYTSDDTYAKILTLFNALFNHSTSASIFITALPGNVWPSIQNDDYLKDFLFCFYQSYEQSIRP